MSTNVPPPAPTSKVALNARDWERRTHQDKELVKGLGLTSATMLVMGSMIGSGIFIVSAEISREVTSPALLIGAWLITGFLTIVGALTYGELAAMMPRAGGQYVYLRESLGPLWGFLYGWTLFLVIQTGTIAAVGVAFGKFLGIFWPAISSSNWIVHKMCIRDRTRTGIEVAHLGLEPIAPDIVVDSMIVDSGTVSSAIAKLFTDTQIKSKAVATAVSGHSVIVKKISLPSMSDQELAETIQKEAAQHIPFDLADVNLDYQILSDDATSPQMDVLLRCV